MTDQEILAKTDRDFLIAHLMQKANVQQLKWKPEADDWSGWIRYHLPTVEELQVFAVRCQREGMTYQQFLDAFEKQWPMKMTE